MSIKRLIGSEAFIFFMAVVATLVFGACGFYSYPPPGSHVDYFQAFYLSAQLFFFNSGAIYNEGTPDIIEYARWMAPFALGAGTIRAFSATISYRFRRLVAARSSGHILMIGISFPTTFLAKNMRKRIDDEILKMSFVEKAALLFRPKFILIVDGNLPSEIDIEDFNKLGTFAFENQKLSQSNLINMSIKTASHVLFASDDDLVNISNLSNACAINGIVDSKFIINVQDESLIQTIDTLASNNIQKSGSKIELDFINRFEVGSRILLEKVVSKMNLGNVGVKDHTFIFVGFGKFAEDYLETVIQFLHIPRCSPVEIVIFYEDEDSFRVNRFKAISDDLRDLDVCKIQFVKLDNSDLLRQVQKVSIEKRFWDMQSLSVFVVPNGDVKTLVWKDKIANLMCISDQAHVPDEEHRKLGIFPPVTNLFYELDEAINFGQQHIKHDVIENKKPNFRIFGMDVIQQAMNPDLIFKSNLQGMISASESHRTYSSRENLSHIDWQKVSYIDRQRNLVLDFYYQTILRYFNAEIEKIKSAVESELGKSTVEQVLSESFFSKLKPDSADLDWKLIYDFIDAEHRRWNGFTLLQQTKKIGKDCLSRYTYNQYRKRINVNYNLVTTKELVDIKEQNIWYDIQNVIKANDHNYPLPEHQIKH